MKMNKHMETVLLKEGYRYLEDKQQEIDIFYKYYEEGFHICMVIDEKHAYMVKPEQHQILQEQIKNLFFRPLGWLADFPEGFPVYHVELLTIFVGGEAEWIRHVCRECQNIWVYMEKEHRLLIYENQPGDFWGLRKAIEDADVFAKPMWKKVKKMPYVTIGLAAVNIMVYLILEFLGDTENALFIAEHGGMSPEFIRYNNQWWRILTAGFIHFGISHLANNMLVFCCVGLRLEPALGHLKMFLLYLFSLVGGGLLSYVMMLHTGDYAVSAGASGAVFGTIAALLWVVIWHRGRFEGLTVRGMFGMLALSLYYGFSTIGVDNWCHLGGAIAGFIAAIILYHRKYQNC